MSATDDKPRDEEPRSTNNPRTAEPGTAVSGFPEPPDEGAERGPTPHSVLNNPVGEPDPTEWPDPYDVREDPLDPPDPDGQPFGEEPRAPHGATSTSQPHPKQDIEAQDRANAPERDKLDQ